VLFDPSQTKKPDGTQLPLGYASVSVFLEGYKAMQEYYPNQEYQIWRANDPTDNPPAVNFAKQVARGTVLNPCSIEFVDSNERVPLGSTVTDVGVEIILGDGRPGLDFSLLDSAKNIIDSDCVFKGDKYAPTADSGLGVVAGVLSCKKATVLCTRPYLTQATTCGGKPAAQCGTLGKDCPIYYQLVATCIM
jgi:hypothetical protein